MKSASYRLRDIVDSHGGGRCGPDLVSPDCQSGDFLLIERPAVCQIRPVFSPVDREAQTFLAADPDGITGDENTPRRVATQHGRGIDLKMRERSIRLATKQRNGAKQKARSARDPIHTFTFQ